MSHIAPVSFKVRATLAAYRIVIADTAGAGFVGYPSAAGVALPLGVTANDVKDTNESIPVIMGGIAKVYFNDTMSSGSLVAADSSGRGVKHVDVTAGSAYVGVLIGNAVTQTGTIADVLVNPGWKAIP